MATTLGLKVRLGVDIDRGSLHAGTRQRYSSARVASDLDVEKVHSTVAFCGSGIERRNKFESQAEKIVRDAKDNPAHKQEREYGRCVCSDED